MQPEVDTLGCGGRYHGVYTPIGCIELDLDFG